MKIFITGILAFSMFFATSVLARDEGNLKILKKPILMSYGVNPLLAVTFNHSSHKDVKCRTCHHEVDSAGKRFVKCTIEECHSTAGARERDPMSMFMAYHARDTDRSCYGCHKMAEGKYPEFRGCRPCHMSPGARKTMAVMETGQTPVKK